MKVSGVPSHDPGVVSETFVANAPPALQEAAPCGFSAVYDRWFHEVCRWVRALGGPEAEMEDLAQEVFLVVRRKLPDFDGRNLPGWLYRITRNTVSDHRRRAWFRRMFLRPRDVDVADFEQGDESPAEELERKESRRMLHGLLSQLSDKHRAAFVLFEIEGYSGEEIAALQGVPVATVWTRLHHARKHFLTLVARHRAKEGA